MSSSPDDLHIEALRELINIGVGRGASVLNTMLNSHIELSVTRTLIVSPEGFRQEMATQMKGRLSVVDMGFSGNLSGTANLMFPADTALALVQTLVGENMEGEDFDAVTSGTLREVGNIVLNGVMGSIANVMGLTFTYDVPGYLEGMAEKLFRHNLCSEKTIVLATTRFKVASLDVNGEIVLFFEVGGLDRLFKAIDNL